MRAVCSFLIFVFGIGAVCATVAKANQVTCKLEAENGLIQQFWNPNEVKFLRNGKVFAEGDLGDRQLGFSNFPWSGIPETWRRAHAVDFVLRTDGDGKLNYVWFSFVDLMANGSVVLRTKQNKTHVRLYFVDPTEGDRALSLVYFEGTTLDTVFNDLSCLWDGGALSG